MIVLCLFYNNYLATHPTVSYDSGGKLPQIVRYLFLGLPKDNNRRPTGTAFKSNFTLKDVLALDWQELEYSDDRKLLNLIVFLTESPTFQCQKTKIFGGQKYCNGTTNTTTFDGFKPVCLDRSLSISPSKCKVLSFGIGNEFSFDSSMAHFGCKVYSFDFSMRNWTNRRYGSRQFYLDFGIGGKNVERIHLALHEHAPLKTSFFTFERIIQILDLSQSKIDVLKMDIEQQEWDVFDQIFGKDPSAKILDNISQIVLEIHFDHVRKINDDYAKTMEKFEKIFLTFQRLNKIGFRLVQWYPNIRSGKTSFVYGNEEASLYKELHFVRISHSARL